MKIASCVTLLMFLAVVAGCDNYSQKASKGTPTPTASSRAVPDLCREQIDHDLKSVRKFFYRIDSNLPEIGESKRKYLELRTEEFRDYRKSEEVRRAILRELYPDPDYHIFELKREVLKTIKAIELLPDAGTIRDLGWRIKHPSAAQTAKDSIQISPWSSLKQHIINAAGAILAAAQAIKTIERTDSALKELGKSELLTKLDLGTTQWGIDSVLVPFAMKVVHDCYVDVLPD